MFRHFRQPNCARDAGGEKILRDKREKELRREKEMGMVASVTFKPNTKASGVWLAMPYRTPAESNLHPTGEVG